MTFWVNIKDKVPPEDKFILVKLLGDREVPYQVTYGAIDPSLIGFWLEIEPPTRGMSASNDD